MQLWGQGGTFILEIRFVEDAAAVAPPSLSADLVSATVYFRRRELTALVDLLRNEKPVFVTINDHSSRLGVCSYRHRTCRRRGSLTHVAHSKLGGTIWREIYYISKAPSGICDRIYHSTPKIEMHSLSGECIVTLCCMGDKDSHCE